MSGIAVSAANCERIVGTCYIGQNDNGAACAANALVCGEISGTVGEVLSAGDRGILKVTPSADGGSEIVVGNPYMFDSSNVAVWEEIF